MVELKPELCPSRRQITLSKMHGMRAEQNNKTEQERTTNEGAELLALLKFLYKLTEDWNYLPTIEELYGQSSEYAQWAASKVSGLSTRDEFYALCCWKKANPTSWWDPQFAVEAAAETGNIEYLKWASVDNKEIIPSIENVKTGLACGLASQELLMWVFMHAPDNLPSSEFLEEQCGDRLNPLMIQEVKAYQRQHERLPQSTSCMLASPTAIIEENCATQ
jgi:hypothetical protein